MRARTAVSLLAAAAALAGCGDEDEPPGKPAAAVECSGGAKRTKRVAVHPRWSEGDTRRLEIAKSRTDTGEPEKNGRHTSTADLEVLSVADAGAVMRWRVDDVVLPSGRQFEGDVREKLRDATRDLVIEYGTDADGAFSRVRNGATIRAYVNDLVDAVVDLTGAAGDDTEAAEAAELRSLLTSEGFVQNVFAQDPIGLHGAYGFAAAEGRSVRNRAQIPNPFGGAALPARVTVRAADARDARGCAVVTAEVVPDPAALERLARSVVRRFSQFSAEEVPPELDLRLRQRSRWTYDPGTGWIVRAELVKLVAMGDRRRRDSTVITLR